MVYGQVIVLKIRVFLLILIVSQFVVFPVWAENAPTVSAASAVLYDPLTDTVIFEKAADTRRGMASTTKINRRHDGNKCFYRLACDNIISQINTAFCSLCLSVVSTTGTSSSPESGGFGRR